VVTGGTDSGVMDIAGKAMAVHDKKRTVPCIGITSFGSLKTAWRETLGAGDDHRNIRIVDAPTYAQFDPGEGMLAGIQQHHTHSILCDGGKRGPGAYGQETEFRAKFEQLVGQARAAALVRSRSPERTMSGSSASKRTINAEIQSAETLRVMILLNGGAVSFESVDLALRYGCPVVVCRGSGRAANFLTAMKDQPDMSYEEAWKAHMRAAADQKSWDTTYGLEKGKMILDRITKSRLLFVFSSSDRLEDVVIGAAIKSLSGATVTRDSLKHSLDLAVQWQCTKHCRDLCARLIAVGAASEGEAQSFQNAAAWIIERMALRKEWIDADPSHLVKLLFECYPKWMKQFPVSCLDTEIKWMGLPKSDRATAPNLFIWCIENGAPTSVVDALWMQQEHPAHAALVAASVYRLTSSNGKRVGSSRADADEFDDLADRYEQFAIDLAKGFDRSDPAEYLFQRAGDWDDTNLVELAHQLECKNFVMERFYTSAVDLLWYTPHPFEHHYFNKGQRTSLAGVSFFEIAWLALNLQPKESYFLTSREFWAVPKIKALTHCVFRVLFICSYSWYVLYSMGLSAVFLRCLLFVWAISLARRGSTDENEVFLP
jgi:hypothetical protein